MTDLPVVVVGAGPQGLAAAAHLLERGDHPLVLEAGDVAAAAVRQWAHVRLFSSWSELVDPARPGCSRRMAGLRRRRVIRPGRSGWRGIWLRSRPRSVIGCGTGFG